MQAGKNLTQGFAKRDAFAVLRKPEYRVVFLVQTRDLWEACYNTVLATCGAVTPNFSCHIAQGIDQFAYESNRHIACKREVHTQSGKW